MRLPSSGVSAVAASMTVCTSTPRFSAIPWEMTWPFTMTMGACQPPFTRGRHHSLNQSRRSSSMSIPTRSVSMQLRMMSPVSAHSPHGMLTLNGPPGARPAIDGDIDGMAHIAPCVDLAVCGVLWRVSQRTGSPPIATPGTCSGGDGAGLPRRPPVPLPSGRQLTCGLSVTTIRHPCPRPCDLRWPTSIRWSRTFREEATFSHDLGSVGAWVGPRAGPARRTQDQKEDYVLPSPVDRLETLRKAPIPFHGTRLGASAAAARLPA